MTGLKRWRKWFGGRNARGTVKPRGRRSSCGLRLEALEDRALPTATLYLDFGDNFTGANGLTTNGTNAVTEANFIGTVNGPDFDNVAGTNTLTFTSFAAEATNAGLTAEQTATMRSSIISLVQRYYSVFDVNIVIASASTLANIQTTLGNTGTSDCYLLIGGITANPGTIGGGLNGQAGGNEPNTFGNTTDDTAVVLANNLFNNGSATLARGDTAFAYTAAHEAGHTFGLEHTINDGPAPADTRRLTNSDMMSQFYNSGIDADQRGTFNFFTRFSLPRAHNSGNYVPYDRLAANVGLKTFAPGYITGTGAFDLITVERVDATFANVTVQAHRDNTFANQIAAFPTYQVNYTNGLLIEGGLNQDRIVVDSNIAAVITVRGMGNAADQLVVNGVAAASGTYSLASTQTPGLDDNSDFRGQIAIAGGVVINFQEFQTSGSVTVQNVGSLTFRTPNSADGLSVDSPAAGQTRIRGSSGDVQLVPLIVSGVANLTVDTATNDFGGTGTDAVSVNLTSGPSTSLVINTGVGGDTVTVLDLGAGFAIPLQVNADGGTDTLRLLSTTATYTPDASNQPDRGTLTAYGGKTIQFTDFEFVTPVAPEITSAGLDQTVINENDSVVLSVQFTDPGSLSSHSVTIAWGDGTTDQFNLLVGARGFARGHQYLDDNPTGTPQDINTIQITISDDDSLTDAASPQVTVNNLAPVIATLATSSTSSGPAAEGEPITISGSFTDVGTLDTHSVTVDWGDGTVSPVIVSQGAGAGTFTGQHAFAAGGIYPILITLRDDDTGEVSGIKSVFVTGVGVHEVGGLTSLQVIGTIGPDQVMVTQQGNDLIRVYADILADGMRTLPAAGLDIIQVVLLAGGDHAVISNTVALPSVLDGGDGDDQLYGGLSSAIMIGGRGADFLSGGNARDILIGGLGADRAVGNGGDDILIGGYTAYDSGADDDKLANDLRLLKLLDEWTSPRTFTERVANLRAGAGPVLAGTGLSLTNGVTVFDDFEADRLTGSAGMDWLFLGSADSSSSGEETN